jgi:ubiquinone biosynthesis protein COQ4
MTQTPPDPRSEHVSLREWIASLAALRRLLANADRTDDVFQIVRGLNVKAMRRAYRRLLSTGEGGRIAFEHVELERLLTDPAYLQQLPAGSVGAAYVRFLRDTGFSADGLAEISRREDIVRDAPHPYAWFARRQRDTHDIWHVLTGYRADDPLGEACLVAFTYAQMGGAGWRLILLGALAKMAFMPQGWRAVLAMTEGYRRGRAARWIAGEDYLQLLHEPFDTALRRLRIAPAPRYAAIQRRLMSRAAKIANDGRIVPS